MRAATPTGRRIALSFSGSGHLHTYQLGAAHHLLTGAHAWADRIGFFAGSSGGAIAATVCALLPPEQISEFARTVSCKGSGFNGLSRALIEPNGTFSFSDTHVRALSNLFLSATHCRTGRNALFSRFRSAAELQRCVHASAAIPVSFHPLDMLKSRPTYPEGGGVIVDPACEWDGGAENEALSTCELPFHPDGEAYVDGGITNTAPLLNDLLDVHTLTISPMSGPQGCMIPPEGDEKPGHFHLTPLDTSLKLPLVAPRLAGMRCYLSVDNLRAFGRSMGAREVTLRRWFDKGIEDASWFTAETVPPAN